MTLEEMIGRFGLQVYAEPPDRGREVRGGYASDMLSDVIANAERGDVWVTMQTHLNIVAVAVLKELAAVVIVAGHKPADETVAAAREKGVCLLGTGLSSFATCGRLYAAGIGIR